MGHYFRRRHEYVLFATKGYRKLSRRDIPDVWRFRRIHRAAYPTQKPVEVFAAMLCGSVEPGFVVCDPFMGSGSAAIAALKHGCSFVGADVSEQAIAITRERTEVYRTTGHDPLQRQSAIENEDDAAFLDIPDQDNQAVGARSNPLTDASTMRLDRQ